MATANETKTTKAKMVTAISVKAVPEKGFNRAGKHWPREETTIPVTDLGESPEDQEAAIAAIMNEPKLVAQIVEIEG